MSAMTKMSRAIRLTIEDHAPTLRELSDDVLDDFVQIIGAFYLDLKDEATRRESGAERNSE
jgi:hypothetical protein